MKKFVCTVCGYIHEGDAAPEQCPICKAPAALIEVAFHDNIDDARFIRSNIGEIAKNLAKSVAETLGVPFKEP